MVASDAAAGASPLMSLVAGGIAGGIESAATYPFEFAKTRVQLYGHTKGTRNPFAVVLRVAREEGPRALYKGCSTMIVGSIGKDAVRFLAFDSIKEVFKDKETGTMGLWRSITAGMVSGIVASTVIVTPTERIKTALIDDAKTQGRFKGALDAIRILSREQGILGALWRGYVTTTLKQIGTTGFRLGTYSSIKDWERSRGWKDIDGPVMSFANGAVAGTVTTLATQPFDTVKTMAQQARKVGTVEVLKGILRDEGIKGLWRGTVMRLGRTVLAGGILFTANEQALRVLKLLTGRS